MNTMSIEMLTPERADALWPSLEPMYIAACRENNLEHDMDPALIHRLATGGMCAVFVGFVDEAPACTIAVQFHVTNGKKGADLIAMAGQHLMTFKRLYWHTIIEWLKANEIQFLDAYVPESRTEIYKKKFGFNKSCACVRMSLQ